MFAGGLKFVSFGGGSRNLEVVMQDKNNWNSVWEVQYLDPQFKMEMEGQAVPTNAPVSLRNSSYFSGGGGGVFEG